MDNTELHYLTYDPQEIWDQMMINYVEAGGDILYPGDEKEMLLRSVQADIVQIFAGVDNALRMQTLRYAVGPYLDMIGELRGCNRIVSSPAKATVTISTNATGTTGVLEAGTTMTADGSVFYALTEDLTLSEYQQDVTVEVECTQVGEIGNALTAGTEMQLSTSAYAEHINSIIVATDAAGGNEEEDDDTYRERIREYGLSSISTGPAQQYESAAKAVSTNILDAKALNLGNGSVGIYLIFESSTGKAAIMQEVLDTLSADDTRPLTDYVHVYEATDIPYVLNILYEYNSGQNVSEAISEAVNEYKEWQENHIGRPFNPDRLMTSLYQAGCTRVTWGAGSVFGTNGAVEYTEIEPNERCKGTISLTGTTAT